MKPSDFVRSVIAEIEKGVLDARHAGYDAGHINSVLGNAFGTSMSVTKERTITKVQFSLQIVPGEQDEIEISRGIQSDQVTQNVQFSVPMRLPG